MKKLFLMAGMFAGASLFAQAAMADAGFKVRGGVASTTYDAEYSGSVTYYKGTSGTSSYNATNFGLTYSTPVGIYFDLAASNGSGTHDSWRHITSAPQSFERSDQTFVIGFPIGRVASVYVGYKNGETEMAAPKGTNVYDLDTGALLGPLGWSKDTFSAKGLILGGGAGFPLGEEGRGGTIGVTGGLGIMKANWKDDNGYSVDADTAVGVSAGVSYTYRFIPNLGVTVDYKFNNYSYNFNYGTVDEFTIGEKTSALGVNLFASF